MKIFINFTVISLNYIEFYCDFIKVVSILHILHFSLSEFYPLRRQNFETGLP
nr:MAG TPA: hypothetical protein [Caudoviricetes sp.]